MKNDFYTPVEMANINVEAAMVKAGRSMRSLIALSLLAGVYIAIGAARSIIMTGISITLGPAISKVLGAAVFYIGIVSVALGGAELFTGNILVAMAFFKRN